MKALIKGLFSLEAKERTIYEFKPGCRTIVDYEQISFEQWCKEFRVSMMYGKEVRHLN